MNGKITYLMRGIFMDKNVEEILQGDRYRKAKNIKPTKNADPSDNTVSKLEQRIEHLENKLAVLTVLFEKQNKSFDEFMGVLRNSQLQDVRAKEKAYNMIANNLKGGLKMFMDESRRSNLQMVSYSSKKIGMTYESTKYKYGEKSYNTKKS